MSDSAALLVAALLAMPEMVCSMVPVEGPVGDGRKAVGEMEAQALGMGEAVSVPGAGVGHLSAVGDALALARLVLDAIKAREAETLGEGLSVPPSPPEAVAVAQGDARSVPLLEGEALSE